MTLTETLPNHSGQHRSDPWGALTEHERARLLQWNDTHADFPQVCTHELSSFKSTAIPKPLPSYSGNANSATES